MDERIEQAVENLHMELVRFGLDAPQQGRVLDHVVEIIRLTLDASARQVFEFLDARKAQS